MEGLALTTDELVEILSTYTATAQAVAAFAAEPGWFVVGAFHMPQSFSVRLNGIASVSHPSLMLHARLFDLTAAPPAPVNGVASTNSRVDVRITSPAVDLIGGHDYQMQVQVIGGSGDTMFGALKSLGLIAA